MTSALLASPLTAHVSEGVAIGPQIASGVVIDEAGNRVHSADVTVYVEEERSDGDFLRPIAEGHTNPQGIFVVRGRLDRNVPATVNSDGTVSIMVDVNDGVVTKHFDFEVRPPAPAGGRPDWSWGDVVDAQMLPAAAAPAAEQRAGRALDGLELRLGTQEKSGGGIRPEDMEGPGADALRAELAEDALVDDVESDQLTLMSHGSCSGYQIWKWIQTDTALKRRWVPTMQIGRQNRTGQRWTFTTSRETSLQIGYAGEAGFYAGGLTKSNTTASGLTSKLTFAASDTPWHGLARHLWKYRQQKQICVEGYTSTKDNVFIESGRYDTGHRRWKPTAFDLSSQKDYTGLYFACPKEAYKGIIQGESGITDGKSMRYENWFSIAGVKLDSQQTETKDTEFTMWPGNGYARAAIFGYNASPGQARILREIKWSERPRL